MHILLKSKEYVCIVYTFPVNKNRLTRRPKLYRIQLALELGLPIDTPLYGPDTLLDLAANYHNVTVVSFLVSAGADINSNNGYPLRRSALANDSKLEIQAERLQCLRILIAAGAKVNCKKGGMALMSAFELAVKHSPTIFMTELLKVPGIIIHK